MAGAMTVESDASVEAFLAGVEPARRREDAQVLDAIFRQATGWQPRLWGSSIVGYGRYRYTYDSGYSGAFLATGFAPRKAKMVVYIMPGYADFGHILDRIGPYKLGKACLYLGSFAKLDLDPLPELIRAGLDDLSRRWEVEPT
ncbi:DUF1801 domain-containing protein [Pseudoponticoccus marisrubri]|uniref:YdhG-like domain-containing protein n=1 Tax=Pseudoponticoccus marisrubri TaxID=1685382 RepID=A0A0W7WLJ9_9RHOB|nr:DUF1801 domain-containing protein [Pseudoponticoccus marisrubri]KUF11449.1 hypothetical protein AVJ23_06700 [Pseudoponticoccus marisrubri]